jgi:acyl carrier protein
MEAVNEFVTQAVADACNKERSAVQSGTLLSDLGFDSMSATALAFAIESHFGCELSQETVVRLYEASTLDEVTSVVARFLTVNNIDLAPARLA